MLYPEDFIVMENLLTDSGKELTLETASKNLQ